MNFFTSFHEQSTFHLSWLRYSTNIFSIQDPSDKLKPIFTNIEFSHQETPHLHKTSDAELWYGKEIKWSDSYKANT